MNDRSDAQSTAPGVPLPSTSSEMVTAIVHFHRAEISRMAGWRNRIDQTTNWAITVVAAMLSVSLSTPSSHHGVLLFAMVLVYLLLPGARAANRTALSGAIVLSDTRPFRELAAGTRSKPEGAAFPPYLRAGILPPAQAQLHLDVPDPSDGLGAQAFHAGAPR